MKPNIYSFPVPGNVASDRTSLPWLGAIESVRRNQVPWLLASTCVLLSVGADSTASLSLERGCMDRVWQCCFKAAEQASSGLSQQLLEQHHGVPCSWFLPVIGKSWCIFGFFLDFLFHLIISAPEEFTIHCRMPVCNRDDDDVKWAKELDELRSLFSGAQKGIRWNLLGTI